MHTEEQKFLRNLKTLKCFLLTFVSQIKCLNILILKNLTFLCLAKLQYVISFKVNIKIHLPIVPHCHMVVVIVQMPCTPIPFCRCGYISYIVLQSCDSIYHSVSWEIQSSQGAKPVVENRDMTDSDITGVGNVKYPYEKADKSSFRKFQK